MKVIIERDPGIAGEIIAHRISDMIVDGFPQGGIDIKIVEKASPSTISLGIAVDSSQAIEATRALDALTEAASRVETALSRLRG